MRASYVPLYCGQDGPLQAILVRQSFSVKDPFVEVVITDKAHLVLKTGVYKPKRVIARVVKVALSQPLVSDSSYCVYVRPT